jgi:hypothetical protein
MNMVYAGMKYRELNDKPVTAVWVTGSLTAPLLGRAIDPCNLAVDKELQLSDGRVHESLGRRNKGLQSLHDLAPVGLAPVAEKSISGSGHSSCK